MKSKTKVKVGPSAQKFRAKFGKSQLAKIPDMVRGTRGPNIMARALRPGGFSRGGKVGKG